MTVYWILLAIPIVAIALTADQPRHRELPPLVAFGAVLVLVIGTRHQVGADWVAYVNFFYQAQELHLLDALLISDPAYGFLNWAVGRMGGGIQSVNVVCGLAFTIGLLHFAWHTPNAWLAVLVGTPYLTIVVAMGYTRQGAALGFELLALGALAAGRYTWFYALVIAGAAFHKTAIALSLLGILSGPQRFSWLRLLSGAVVVYLSVTAFLADTYEVLLRNYVETRRQSSGGMVRALMNAVPAGIWLLLRKPWMKRFPSGGPWLVFSIGSILAVPLVLVASTAVDRAALYLSPLQLYVWAYLPNLSERLIVRPIIVAYHAAVLYVWLEFATYAEFWVPYQSYLW